MANLSNRVAKYAAEIAEMIEADGKHVGTAYALGIIRALADPGTGYSMSEAERLASIRDALQALDVARGGAR